MSKLSNIKDIYGKEFAFAVANIHAWELLKYTSLPSNTIIITAPTNEDVNCIVMTDNEGTPVRLTYAIKPGNGLFADKDVLYIQLDNNLINTENGIAVNLSHIIDNETIYISENKLCINTNKLQCCSELTSGVFKIDNSTVKIQNNSLYVDTDNLLLADSEIYGIARGDNNTVTSDMGILSVNTQELTKADNTEYGIAMPDNNTIEISDEGLHIVTAQLEHANTNCYGVSVGDNITLITKDGLLTPNMDAINKCSNDTFGIAKINTNSLQSNNGVIDVLDENVFHIKTYENLLRELQNIYTNFSNLVNEKILYNSIKSISFNSTAVTNLQKPDYKEEIINMPEQLVYIILNIKTSSDFKVDVDFINNISPAASVKKIIYDSDTVYSGPQCLNNTFKSTNNTEKRLDILISCYNFSSDTLGYNCMTNIKINVYNAKDSKNSKKVTYIIIRYNSKYKIVNDTIEELNTITTYVYTVNLFSSFWSERLNDKYSSTKHKIYKAKNALKIS